jgi:phosphate:Na+ symporter
MSFNLDAIAPLFILAGAVMALFFKKLHVKRVGEILLGFGILFFGMSTMKSAMSDLQNVQVVKQVIGQLRNPFLAILVGLVVTTLIQSSSATVGILIGMGSAGLLPDIQMVFYIIMGCNIGACSSALLAGLAAKKDAKRASMLHFSFNVIGTIVLVILLAFCGDWYEAFLGEISDGNMARMIANTHTIFKVFQVLIMMPFTKGLVRLSHLLVPGEDEKEEGYALQYISISNVIPSTAMYEAVCEIKRMGALARENLNLAMDALFTLDEEKIARVYELEHEVDFLSDAITNYLVMLNQKNVPIRDVKHIDGYFHVVSDLERISDHAENIAEFAQTKKKDAIQFSEKGEAELRVMWDTVDRIIGYAVDSFTEQTEAHLAEIVQLENKVDELEKKGQLAHVKRIYNNECSPKAMIFTDLLSNLERVSDHATNIAFAIYDEEQYMLEE